MRRNVFTTYDPNLPSGKKFVAVHVQNEDPLYFLVEVKSKVCELFAQINKFLNLLEPELFGLAIRCADAFVFLDPLEKLSKYAPKQWRTQNNGMDNDGLPLFNVYFRVQFYVDSYLFISDKVAKLLYYHQMRENVLHYGQSIGEERAFLLASYALQADYGNYNGQLHKDHYFEPSHYFPNWVIEELGVDYIVRHLPALHCDHKGMSKSEAQSMYIKEASDPIAPHNFHFYQLACKKGANSSDVWLAITVSGIAIYAEETSTLSSLNTSTRSYKSRLKSRISFFPWSDIGKLSFEKKKFEIRSTGNQGRKFVYYAASEEISRHLLWFARACHQFYLMVQPKIKEMLKREAEINRKKYRESCISSTSSSNSSSGNSSGSSSGNPSSNTSKSASPFEYSSTSSTSSAIHKKGTSDLDISNSSVCGEDNRSNSDQRISVISNASSNTTSGIVSDKVHGLEDSDRDDIDSDILMGLNHRHHGVSRAITLSGCSPQPVVSLESLALSEPIEHRSCRNADSSSKSMNLASNKKHSISISNIMITSTSTTPTSTSSLLSSNEPAMDTFSNSSSPCANQTTVTSYNPANEVLVTGENCSKVLCLNINESTSNDSTCCSLSPYEQLCTDDESSYDETDSVFDNTSKSYTSGKSNVTVLSTILKPEAERLLKQGIEADDAELMIDDGIDSIELAELKEFEQAEKEKIILNSLINKLPPPPPLSSDSDSSSDEDDDRASAGTRHSCYSPLTQEKMHKMRSSPKDGKQCSKVSPRSAVLNRTPPKSNMRPSVSKENGYYHSRQAKLDRASNHIYENLKCQTASRVANGPSRSLQVEALVTPQKGVQGLPPPVPLRQCPSLNAFPSTYSTPSYPHRTGMRIGVSSLNRPYANRTKHSLLTGGCYHNNGTLALAPNGSCCSNLFDTSTLSAGSEPNLYFQSNNCWPSSSVTRDLASNKSDSVFDCRVNVPSFTVAPTSQTNGPTNQPLFSTPYQQSTLNSRDLTPSQLTQDLADLKLHSQDNNNNIQTIYQHQGNVFIPPPADYATPNSVSPDEQTPPQLTSSVASHKLNRSNGGSNLKSKSKEGSISDLHQLRQRSSDLNLPLITALFNDSSLMDQLKANEQNEKMSQSLQQIPQKVARSSNGHSSGATIERTSTFRVDEAIAKSTLRQHANDNNNNQPDYSSPNSTTRPTSWHMDNSCSGHNRLFANGVQPQYYSPKHCDPHHTPNSAQKLYNSDFVERLWAEHQLTT